jgi:hypothetical protein
MVPSLSWRLAAGFGCFVLGLSSGCSTVKTGGSASGRGALEEAREASQLISNLCPVQGSVQSVEGRVWMKAKSKEASGQFPAIVQASAQKGLRLEVTQLMGARAALIEIRGQDFKVETPQQGSVSKKAKSWGGIPLEWASSLFLNGLPCPDVSAGNGSWKWGFDAQGRLKGSDSQGTEVWLYSITQRQSRTFVEKVTRERGGKVEFELTREDPDPEDGWARRWEIKSGVGEVKVRWRDRKAS